MSLRSGVSAKVNSTQGGYARTGGAPGPKAGAKGTAMITLDELDRIRSQVAQTKDDSY